MYLLSMRSVQLGNNYFSRGVRSRAPWLNLVQKMKKVWELLNTVETNTLLYSDCMYVYIY